MKVRCLKKDTVTLNGKEYQVNIPADVEVNAMIASLLCFVALENEHVDAILHTFGITLQDNEGNKIFPRP